MNSFTDCEGRKWNIPRLTVGMVQDIAHATEVNLYKAAEDGGKLIEVLFSPFTLAAVLWLLCCEQAEKAGIDEVKFAYGLSGESLEQAGEALMGAVIDFFPRSKVGKAMKVNLSSGMDRIDEAAVAMLKRSSGDLPE